MDPRLPLLVEVEVAPLAILRRRLIGKHPRLGVVKAEVEVEVEAKANLLLAPLTNRLDHLPLVQEI